MKSMTRLQELSFEIIAAAGEAKSYAYEALNNAKNNEKELYEENMAKAEEMMNSAHKIQFDLLAQEAKEELDAQFSILVVHAQDHLMTTLSSIDLIKELAEMYFKHVNKE